MHEMITSHPDSYCGRSAPQNPRKKNGEKNTCMYHGQHLEYKKIVWIWCPGGNSHPFLYLRLGCWRSGSLSLGLTWSLIKQFIPIPRAYICNQIIITRTIMQYKLILKIFGILYVNILWCKVGQTFHSLTLTKTNVQSIWNRGSKTLLAFREMGWAYGTASYTK
jgi:hypothetical protein